MTKPQPPTGRTPYWLGEEGPEPFIPDRAGHILTSTEVARLFKAPNAPSPDSDGQSHIDHHSDPTEEETS